MKAVGVMMLSVPFAQSAMSEYQVARFAAVQKEAKDLSDGATPQLLSAFDEPPFRVALKLSLIHI